jgi:TonB family protein
MHFSWEDAMWSAHERKHLDRRSLGLSIAFHLLLLLLLVSQWHQFPVQPPQMAYTPELILNLPEPPKQDPDPAHNPDPPKDSTGLDQARSKPDPGAATVETVVDSPAPPLLQPVVQSVVRLPEPTPTPMSSANPRSEPAAGIAFGATAVAGAGGNGAAANSGGGGGPGSGIASAERPDWIEQPTMRQRMRVLSIEAARNHANGWAVLSCLVTHSKRVRDCKVLGESRDSHGGRSYAFGESALQLSHTFRVRPPMRNGLPRYDIRVRIPIYWSWKASED